MKNKAKIIIPVLLVLSVIVIVLIILLRRKPKKVQPKGKSLTLYTIYDSGQGLKVAMPAESVNDVNFAYIKKNQVVKAYLDENYTGVIVDIGGSSSQGGGYVQSDGFNFPAGGFSTTQDSSIDLSEYGYKLESFVPVTKIIAGSTINTYEGYYILKDSIA